LTRKELCGFPAVRPQPEQAAQLGGLILVQLQFGPVANWRRKDACGAAATVCKSVSRLQTRKTVKTHLQLSLLLADPAYRDAALDIGRALSRTPALAHS
jgi:hypothetical protein